MIINRVESERAGGRQSCILYVISLADSRLTRLNADPGMIVGNNRSILGLSALALVSAGLLFGVTQADRERGEDATHVSRIRSVTLSARRAPSDSTLAELQSMGLTHLTLIPFAFQRGITSTDIRYNPNARWYSESDVGIRALSDSAHARGMEVILKPHVWVGRGSGEEDWRSNINFDTDADWEEWEAGYRAFILHHAALAADIGAGLFVVGTELMTPAVRREEFWRKLIAETRTVFPGRITYAANWWREYSEIQFWDALDYIGVQAYFPVGSGDNATVAELQEGWQPHVAELRKLSVALNKPVLFTEIGYRSFTGATERPWEWPTREQAREGIPNLAIQSSLYEAFFRSLWDQDWFAGAILWRWYTQQERDGSTHEIDFTPQNKPAQEVIRTWFLAGAR